MTNSDPVIDNTSAISATVVTAQTTAADVTLERDAELGRGEERREEGVGGWSTPVPPPDTTIEDVPAADEITRLICEGHKFDRNDDNDNPLVPGGELR